MATGDKTYFESDGESVNVSLVSTIEANMVVLANGWLGISNGSGNSGGSVAVSIDRNEYQFTVPAALAVSKGDIVRIDTTAVTGTNIPPDAAYNKSALSATNINLFKATEAKNGTTHVVSGILLSGL